MNLRTQQREATQASLLQAALEVFSEKGFEGASTREIAALAGAHNALIKYHFSSKDALWRAAVAFLFERQATELAMPRHDDPAFAFAGAAESTATRPSRGTRWPGAAIPEFPRKARLPMRTSPSRIHPPRSS